MYSFNIGYMCVDRHVENIYTLRNIQVLHRKIIYKFIFLISVHWQKPEAATHH